MTAFLLRTSPGQLRRGGSPICRPELTWGPRRGLRASCPFWRLWRRRRRRYLAGPEQRGRSYAPLEERPAADSRKEAAHPRKRESRRDEAAADSAGRIGAQWLPDVSVLAVVGVQRFRRLRQNHGPLHPSPGGSRWAPRERPRTPSSQGGSPPRFPNVPGQLPVCADFA